MTIAETYSWIFYSVGMVSSEQGVTIKGIEQIADGINHAIPTQKEITASIKWLDANGLIEKEGKIIRLTKEGNVLLAESKLTTKTTAAVWKVVKEKFVKMGLDNTVSVNPRNLKPAKNSSLI